MLFPSESSFAESFRKLRHPLLVAVGLFVLFLAVHYAVRQEKAFDPSNLIILMLVVGNIFFLAYKSHWPFWKKLGLCVATSVVVGLLCGIFLP